LEKASEGRWLVVNVYTEAEISLHETVWKGARTLSRNIKTAIAQKGGGERGGFATDVWTSLFC